MALLLAATPAALAGPGITFYPKAGPVLELSGGQIASIANTASRTYTLPPDSERAGQKVTLRGVSIGALVARSGQSAQRVQVVKRNGGSVAVTPPNFATALIADSGGTTYYIRSSGGVVTEFIESSDIPLEVSVDGGDLVVKAKANRKKVQEGESVTFEATVSGGKPGVAYSFEWDFGEGPVNGKRVSYSPDLPGVLFAQVSVRDPDPGCTLRCSGTEQVEVEVGEAPEQPDDPAAGGANGTPGGAGSAGGTGGGGTGGSGGGGGGGAGTDTGEEAAEEGTAPAAKPEPKPPPPPPKPFGETISGVLINDTGATARKLPGGEPAGGAEGVRAVRGGDTEGAFPLALGGLLALAVMWVGALRERRGVRLRVA
ncbi:MAG: PKD domain-containing protein [Solirubrobacteraceae bacterium]|nr:PKD domain-containing protein [Solirubrobacteraceae bacterium]